MPDSSLDSPPPRASRRPRRFIFPAILITVIIASPLVWLGMEIGARRSRHALIEEIEASGGMILVGPRDHLTGDWRGTWENSLEWLATRESARGQVSGVLILQYLPSDGFPPLVPRIARLFPTLKNLSLSCAELDRESMKALARLKSLESLELGHTSVTDQDLAQIAQLGQFLELKLDFTDVSDLGLVHLSELSELRALSLKGTRVSSDAVAKFRQEHPLVKVDWTARLTDDAMQAIGELNRRRWGTALFAVKDQKAPHVRVFPFAQDLKPTDADRRLFARLPPFDMSLSSQNSTSAFLDFAVQLEPLEGLLVYGIDDQDLRRIVTIKRLKRLNIRYSSLTDQGLASLRLNTNLTDLTIVPAPFTRKGIEHITQIEGLQHLSLYKCGASGDDLEPLARLTQLETIFLEDVTINERGLRHFATLKNLKTLSLPGAAFDDSLIPILLDFPTLEKLDLHRASISNAVLQQLVHLPKLKELQCSGALGITDKALGEFRAQRPDVRVHGL